MKKFIVLSIVLLMLAGFAITSSAIAVADLYADQIILVGTLTVVVVGDNLEVTYEITELGWELLETHLYVGEDPPGKSAPGKFPYKDEEELTEGVTLVKYSIPLSDFGEVTSLYIAAHAVVTNPETPYTICEPREETAWARWCVPNTELIRPGKNWATYFIFYL